MQIRDVARLLNADILSGGTCLDREVKFACGCDLMSDALAFIEDGTLLLTGLTNLQVIRTAKMIDVFVIVFVRGKVPANEVIDMAKERNIILMSTDYTLFEACGILYQAGLKGKS